MQENEEGIQAPIAFMSTPSKEPWVEIFLDWKTCFCNGESPEKILDFIFYIPTPWCMYLKLLWRIFWLNKMWDVKTEEHG